MAGLGGLGLGPIFNHAFHAQNWSFHGANPRHVTPGVQMSGRSPFLNAIRQTLPRKAGGYSPSLLRDLKNHAKDPKNALETLVVGQYPTVDLAPPGEFTPQQQLGPWGKRARAVAQVGGATLADVVTQGLPNLYWFLNAWETLGMTAGRYGQHGALNRFAGAPKGAPFGGMLNTASVFPLILGASAASGTLFRQPGYEAVLPDRQGDRRDSTDPAAERVMRIIGRHGRMLPFDEFTKDRPDVSREQYDAYRRYRYGDRSILKGTMDGIHGPEVNFLGRSMPVLTGMLPIAGGVLGARAGLRMAGHHLDQTGAFARDKASERSMRQANREFYSAKGLDAATAAKGRYKEQAYSHFDGRWQTRNRLLGGTIAGSAIGLGITAAGSQLLERMRRSANARANQQQAQAEEPLAPAA
jgi:hypothetical protein